MGMRPLPTTAITPGVTRIGSRLIASNWQNTYPEKRGAVTSLDLPFLAPLAVNVGRRVRYPFPDSKVAVEFSQRARTSSAYHWSGLVGLFIVWGCRNHPARYPQA